MRITSQVRWRLSTDLGSPRGPLGAPFSQAAADPYRRARHYGNSMNRRLSVFREGMRGAVDGTGSVQCCWWLGRWKRLCGMCRGLSHVLMGRPVRLACRGLFGEPYTSVCVRGLSAWVCSHCPFPCTMIKASAAAALGPSALAVFWQSCKGRHTGHRRSRCWNGAK